MRVVLLIVALIGATQAAVSYEEIYSIELDSSPMARLARDHMPHIKTKEQLREMEVELRANMNKYVDRLLGNAKTFMVENELDPMKLPDYIRTFSYTILWVNWHGGLVVNNGKLQDLSTIFRNGDVNIDYDKNTLLLDAAMGFKDLQFSYDYSATFMGIGPKGYIEGRGDSIKIQFKIHVDMNSFKAGLDLFNIQDIGEMHVDITGLGVFLDWLVDTIANCVLMIFKEPIVELINTEVGKALANLIANLDIGSFIPH